MAGLCLRRSVRWARCSDGAGLAEFIASAVTERSVVINLAQQPLSYVLGMLTVKGDSVGDFCYS